MAYNRESWLKGNELRQVPVKGFAESVLIGTLLGDGCLVKTSSGKCYLSLHHCARQKEWLLWKARMMPMLFIRPFSIRHIKGTNSYQLRSICRDDLESYRSLQAKLGKLDLLALSVWYGDDGSLWKGNDETCVIELGAMTKEGAETCMRAVERIIGPDFSLNRRAKWNKKSPLYYWRLRFGYMARDIFANLLLLPKVISYKMPDYKQQAPSETNTATFRQFYKRMAKEGIVRSTKRLVGVA